MANDSVFSADPVEPVVDITLNDLVGEGRKYNDPDALAKAYANVEAHARRLEAENAQARAQLDQAQATNNTVPPSNTGTVEQPQANPPVAPTNSEAPTSGKQTDYRSQIREEIKALNEQERAVHNTEQAASKMIEVYGDATKANEAVKRRADELGVSIDWLRDSASRSPQAFFATMGITGSGASHSTPASSPGVRLEGPNGSVKNFEYFDRMRKDDPKTYFSANTQRDMLNQARAQGSDFYKR